MASNGYTPLASSIVYSSVWTKTHEVVRVWIAMLALMDKHSRVYGTVPGMAYTCHMDVKTFLECEKVLLETEPDVPNKDDDGRRIERVDGGWIVLNGKKWREKFRSEARKKYQAQWKAEKRAEQRLKFEKEVEARTAVLPNQVAQAKHGKAASGV